MRLLYTLRSYILSGSFYSSAIGFFSADNRVYTAMATVMYNFKHTHQHTTRKFCVFFIDSRNARTAIRLTTKRNLRDTSRRLMLSIYGVGPRTARFLISFYRERLCGWRGVCVCMCVCLRVLVCLCVDIRVRIEGVLEVKRNEQTEWCDGARRVEARCEALSTQVYAKQIRDWRNGSVEAADLACGAANCLGARERRKWDIMYIYDVVHDEAVEMYAVRCLSRAYSRSSK